MAGSKVLVFGGTGPAGNCLLRELLHRNHQTLAYARNTAKIPNDLKENPLLEVVQGELGDADAVAAATFQARVIISLLGPNTIRGFEPSTYTDFYRVLFGAMRQHGVKRIFAMGTLSIADPDDVFSLKRLFIVGLVRTVVNPAYQLITAVGRLFVDEAHDLDWTVYRIAGIPGGSDEASWKQDREDGETFEGYVGQQGWTASQKRGALTRWLVDAVEDGKTRWIRKMPAISRLAGSVEHA
ncbi:hypothetical protein B0T18DRAFT_420582 [Schizothecium vesticola]|uniref:NAD(P)-binding domain-containing protein n=1 Tax=Schizothecium vesticola TaxID=314040 RepID=A0AA40BP72_9PEZI|nr:hypothetical protein B0T18DRAFT_420582 [Schizothecium vesticola]